MPITFKPATKFESTWLQDEIDIDYSDLVKVFGKPHNDGDGYKVDAQWELKFSDGTHATIYNYKNGINYNGKDGTPTEEITEWHIGGQTIKAGLRVKSALGIR